MLEGVLLYCFFWIESVCVCVCVCFCAGEGLRVWIGFGLQGAFLVQGLVV